MKHFRRPARSGEEWSLAEDRRLLRLVRRYRGASKTVLGAEVLVRVARELGRSPSAIVGRFYLLRNFERRR